MSETSESEASTLSAGAPLEPENAGHARRNYWVTVIEGGSFIGGMAFLNSQTLLPDMIDQLGGSSLLVALTPSLMMIGFWIAPVLTAHWVDGMSRYMPFVTVTGFLQRIPYLIAAVALFYAAREGATMLALAAVVAAPAISGTAGGVSLTAWQQLVARCIPEKNRASLFASRYIIACILGVTAGIIAKLLFRELSLLNAYAMLHLFAFLFIAISFFVYLGTREPHCPKPPVHTLTLAQNLRLMPQLIAANPIFGRYLASRLFRSGYLVITPFLAIYAREHLNRPEAFLGTLLIAQNIGAILGNLGAAWLGDRAGGKLVNQLALGIYIILSIWAIFAGSSAEFIAIFFLMGAAYYAGEVGAFTLMLEILPTANRATCLAITSLANIPGVLAAGWISSAVWKNTHSISLLAIASIATLAGSMLLLQPIREPRKAIPARENAAAATSAAQ